MLWTLFGVYTLFLVMAWGFFVVARIHAYKFKNFSERLEFITNILFVLLLTLSISGYVIIFTSDFGGVNLGEANYINNEYY